MLSKFFSSWKAAPASAATPPLQQLEEAAIAGDLLGVQAAIRSGCAIDERLALGMTPLMTAAVNGKADTCRWLIAQGANATLRADDGSTCLHWASTNGTIEVLEMLLQAGANPEATDDNGWTAPFQSVSQDNDELLSFWLDRGVSPNCRTLDGQSLLHFAAALGKGSCVAALLERGPDLEMKDSEARPRC